MTRGEALKILVDYDIFGVNAKNKIGAYLKTNEATNKHLVYFFDIEEWGEFEDDWVERVDPGKIPSLHKDFVSRIKTLETTYGP